MEISFSDAKTTIVVIHYPTSSLDVVELPLGFDNEKTENYLTDEIGYKLGDIHWAEVNTINFLTR